MTTNYSWRGHFEVSPALLLEVLSDPRFLEERHLAQGAAEARTVELSRDERQLLQRVELAEYARTMTGVDRRRTESASVTYEWDLPGRSCRWSYRGPHDRLVQVSGEMRVLEDGEGAALELTFSMTVKMPLVGKTIERRGVREVEESSPRFVELVGRFLAARGAEAAR